MRKINEDKKSEGYNFQNFSGGFFLLKNVINYLHHALKISNLTESLRSPKIGELNYLIYNFENPTFVSTNLKDGKLEIMFKSNTHRF